MRVGSDDLEWPNLTRVSRSRHFWSRISSKTSYGQSYYSTLIGNHTHHMEWYHVWWPRLTSKCVARFVSDSWVSCSIDLLLVHLNFAPVPQTQRRLLCLNLDCHAYSTLPSFYRVGQIKRCQRCCQRGFFCITKERFRQFLLIFSKWNNSLLAHIVKQNNLILLSRGATKAEYFSVCYFFL